MSFNLQVDEFACDKRIYKQRTYCVLSFIAMCGLIGQCVIQFESQRERLHKHKRFGCSSCSHKQISTYYIYRTYVWRSKTIFIIISKWWINYSRKILGIQEKKHKHAIGWLHVVKLRSRCYSGLLGILLEISPMPMAQTTEIENFSMLSALFLSSIDVDRKLPIGISQIQNIWKNP